MSIRKTLSTASKLVSSGEYKVAIDLLLEYLEVDPNSLTVLNTLGRAYLLDHQPEQAIIYLKRSLEVTQSHRSTVNHSSKYQPDSFCNDDMAFIESQAYIFSEEDYILDVDEYSQTTARNETKVSTPSSGDTIEPEELQSKNSVKKVKNVSPSINSNDTFPTDSSSDENKIGAVSDRSSTHANREVRNANPADVNNNEIVKEKNRQPPTISGFSVKITAPNSNTGTEASNKQAIDKIQILDRIENEDLDLFENEQIFLNGILDDNNKDQDEEILDEFAPTFNLSIEESSEELIWDDFEGLDEFDELAHQKAEEEVQYDEKISRESRARQIAVEVLEKSDWDLKHLSLLQKIFIENGWSAARKMIDREIVKGLSPEELLLARKIRQFWLGNEQFWITFQKIKYDARFQQTDATYKCMSWPESLRIIRCFPSLPDIEEIYMFIDEVFDHWYNSSRLISIYPAFLRFLKYRLDSMRRALPGETVFSFLYYVNVSSDVDTDTLNNITSKKQDLLNLGIQLNQWPRPPENKIKVLRN